LKTYLEEQLEDGGSSVLDNHALDKGTHGAPEADASCTRHDSIACMEAYMRQQQLLLSHAVGSETGCKGNKDDGNGARWHIVLSTHHQVYSSITSYQKLKTALSTPPEQG
jgi:hypothetical protein